MARLLTFDDNPQEEYRAWVVCPKCGAYFEVHGTRMRDLKFRYCISCGYQDPDQDKDTILKDYQSIS